VLRKTLECKQPRAIKKVFEEELRKADVAPFVLASFFSSSRAAFSMSFALCPERLRSINQLTLTVSL
jgi:hypothetical protein